MITHTKVQKNRNTLVNQEGEVPLLIIEEDIELEDNNLSKQIPYFEFIQRTIKSEE